MTVCWTSAMRALVAATLLLATATLMLVAVSTARAAGALPAGKGAACKLACDFSGPQQKRADGLIRT